MSDLNFIETKAAEIYDQIITELENGVAEPLYPGDERRIFGEALVQVVVAVYNSVNDACRQKMLRYARAEVLDALGENRDTPRLDPTYATTTLRFGVNEPVNSNIVIPAGLKVTGDFVHYFLTDATVVLYAGTDSVTVNATAENGGASYNDIGVGELVKIVDISDVPLIDYVTNSSPTAGGGDYEDDETYRERIRQAENKLSTAGPPNAYKYWALSANSLITDAIVESERETISRKLRVYDGHVFKGGSDLEPDTLIVYLPGGNPAKVNDDYTAKYEDELLTIELYGELAGASEVDIEIVQVMRGRVKITPICAGGEIPDEEVLNEVREVCTASDIRPLTDKVTVQAPGVHYYDIDLTYWTTKLNESEVVQNVEGNGGAIARYNYQQGSALAQDINPDDLRRLILAPDWEENLIGATRCEILAPVYTELNSTTVAKFSGNINVKHFVKG